MNFYAYLWLRENGTPYYVGKGKGRRALKSADHCVRRPKDRSRIVIILCRNEAEAFETEKNLILNWGRKDNGTGILRNMTDGGDGPSGYRFSEELKARLRGPRAPLGPMTEEHKRKIGESNRGVSRPGFRSKHTVETRAHLKNIRNTEQYKNEQAERTRFWWNGLTEQEKEEHRIKMRHPKRRNGWDSMTAETKAARIAATVKFHTGRKRSPEVCKKIKESRWPKKESA